MSVVTDRFTARRCKGLNLRTGQKNGDIIENKTEKLRGIWKMNGQCKSDVKIMARETQVGTYCNNEHIFSEFQCLV